MKRTIWIIGKLLKYAFAIALGLTISFLVMAIWMPRDLEVFIQYLEGR